MLKAPVDHCGRRVQPTSWLYSLAEARAISIWVAACPVEYGQALRELNLSEQFVYLPAEKGRLWKDGLERYVRQGCDTLGCLN